MHNYTLLHVFIFSIQIWNYVELSDSQNPWNDSDDPTLRYMYYEDIQLTICEKGPFPSKNVPPSYNSE